MQSNTLHSMFPKLKNPGPPMYAEFEHDRRVLNVCFYNTLLGGIDQVNLVLRYSAIRYCFLIIIRRAALIIL